jgi:hypothetical protein
MKTVSVTRIFNEEDIVEAFVRHNATLVDQMLFLDNGSSDATLEILRALQAEGVALSVFQCRAVNFDEVAVNSWLYQLASQTQRADWVVFLDADEFLDPPPGAGLADYLRGIGILIEHRRYVQAATDDALEPIAPKRQTQRTRSPTDIWKLIVRGGLGAELAVDAGNHGAHLGERALVFPQETRLTLAHYPRRDGYQNLQKIVIGWLKVLATGNAAVTQGISQHYRSPFETLRDTPERLVGNPAYLAAELNAVITTHDPIAYRGGALRYTRPGDPGLRALQLCLRHAEQLAQQHGALLEALPAARQLVDAGNGQRVFLF